MADTSNTSATWEKWMQHECNKKNMSETGATQVRHKCYTSVTWVLNEDTSATRVKNFDFGNGTSKTIFSCYYIYYMASERLQGEEQFHSKRNFLEMHVHMPKCVWKVHHKNWTF